MKNNLLCHFHLASNIRRFGVMLSTHEEVMTKGLGKSLSNIIWYIRKFVFSCNLYFVIIILVINFLKF